MKGKPKDERLTFLKILCLSFKLINYNYRKRIDGIMYHQTLLKYTVVRSCIIRITRASYNWSSKICAILCNISLGIPVWLIIEIFYFRKSQFPIKIIPIKFGNSMLVFLCYSCYYVCMCVHLYPLTYFETRNMFIYSLSNEVDTIYICTWLYIYIYI